MISYFIVGRKLLSLNFRSFLVRIPFLQKWFHFRLVISGWSVFRRTLRTFSLLMDGGIPAFTITLFYISVSSHQRLACRKIFLFCLVFPDHSFVTTKSPTFFFICLKVVAFEYFQYDLVFNISEWVFPASWCR